MAIKRIVVVVLICVFQCVNGLHLKGTWNPNQFFKFLSKFGFQKTNMHDLKGSQGYIFGNITATNPAPNTQYTFVVVDSEYFIEYFGNSTEIDRSKACSKMFKRINMIAWDVHCHQQGTEDFLRRIPCPESELCEDEDNPAMVIKGYQFTYRVQDTNQPRFWYVSLVGCARNNTSCTWIHPTSNTLITYDIWLVNGDPNQNQFNPFEHQFSFEMHDIVEIYLIFFVLYLILAPVELYSLSKRKHTLSVMVFVVIGMQLVAMMFNSIHFIKFSFDGEGVAGLGVLGDCLSLIATTAFMSVLMLIAKGWTITVKDLGRFYRKCFVVFWTLFMTSQLSLFVWKQLAYDVISAEDSWQTLPGALMLLLTTVMVFWFLYELKNTFAVEENFAKMSFYLHFGAGFLCWFVYMPVLALVCSQVSALWRYKTLLGVSNAFNWLAVCCMVHILWPGTSQYNVLFSSSQISSISAVRSSHVLEGQRLLGDGEGKRLLGDGEDSSDLEERESERELEITLLNRD